MARLSEIMTLYRQSTTQGRDRSMSSKNPEPANVDLFGNPNAPVPGDCVRLYDNGWRVGILIEVVGKMARVKDILGKKRAKFVRMDELAKVPHQPKDLPN